MQTTVLPVITGKWYYYWLSILVLSLVPGLFTTLMEQDAALYAGIAKQIVWRNDWVNLYANGADWLDKPHLPFWITAASFKLLGIGTFSYKLPAFLCWLGAAWYTGALTRHFYGVNTGRVAVLIFLSALHGIISINDVRAEPYLTFFLIASSFHLVKAERAAAQLFPAALFTAAAVMTKGPFVLIPIGGGMLIHWMVKGEWKQFLNWKWYVYLLLTAVFTIPELWCLYLQFDARPELQVFGQKNVSGIRFFLWDSQFGRFFNTGPIKGKGDPFFFLHTLLWAFLSWSILLYAGIVAKFRTLFSGERKAAAEWISFGAGLLTLLVFSLSRFQLPHYLNILFPYFSMLLAAWLLQLKSASAVKNVFFTQRVVSLLMMILPAVVIVLFRPPYWWIYLLLTGGFLWVWWVIKTRDLSSALRTGLAGSVAVALFLNLFFYPALLEYQGGSVAAEWKNKKHPGRQVQFWEINSYGFEFYSDAPVLRSAEIELPLLYTSRAGLAKLDSMALPYTVDAVFSSFPVTRLNGRFLNPASRASRLDSVWLLQVNAVDLNNLEKK